MKRVVASLALFAALMFTSTNSLLGQLIVGPGQTVTLSNVAVISDIIVEDGGTLVIQNQVIMGWAHTPQLRILIEDGGRMISNGASLYGHSPDSFLGVIVEGTDFMGNTDLALDLNNFSLFNAELGLELSANKQNGGGSTINQAVSVRNSYFHDCTGLLRNYGQLGYASTFNRDNSHNPVVFENCNFSSSGGSYWTIHISSSNYFHFDGCRFDIADDWNLHFNMTRNMTVTDCEFVNPDSVLGMVFHRDNFDPLVTGNVFYGPGASVNYGAVLAGAIFHQGKFHGGLISKNTFHDCKVGLGIGDADVLLGGNSGEANGTRVVGNTFDTCRVGIQSEKSSGLIVASNDFLSCRNGLLFNGNANSNPRVTCNLVTSCINGFRITDTQLTSMNHPFIDPHNRFFAGGTHIAATNGVFSYDLYWGWYSGKPSTFVGVTINFSWNLGWCKRWPDHPEDDGEDEDEGGGDDAGDGGGR